MDSELEKFKSEISLVDYAQAEFGYELVKRESSKSSRVLKCGGDKIIVTRQKDGHDVYFSTGDAADSGSIVDFLQKRKPVNLGQVRKELRGWIPGSKRPSIKVPKREPDRIEPTTKDRTAVLAGWARLKPYAGSYLTRERCIDSSIIEAFDVRQDVHGNACFAHRDAVTGVLGWELKNKGFAGFSAGGQRNVHWTKLDAEPLRKIVITEAAIDAMSYAQLKHEPGTAYVSTSGTQFSPEQRAQIAALVTKHGVSIVLAMDNDPAGEAMAQQLREMVPKHVSTVRDVPTKGKDWNDELRALTKERELAEQRSRAGPSR